MVATAIDRARALAEGSLPAFIKLVAPQRMLGSVHEEVINFWCREGAQDHQLTLLPRGHQKSALIAFRAAWEITKDPSVTILYISSTSNLAEKQLKTIKDILQSRVYQKYWPDMIGTDEGKREKWTNREISVDHPKRKYEGVRDPTIFTAGLTTNIVGMHCDITIMDDVVTPDNAYTNEGRNRVHNQYSLLASISNPGGREWVVGTRYHPKDLYEALQTMAEDVYDDDGEVEGTALVYETFERKVEDRGDGTGEFLWPKQRRTDGKWFGFDNKILAKKRAQYIDKTQFRAQYYNDPNDPTQTFIDPSNFQYYERSFLKQDSGYWFYKDKRLNVFASIDFAFSLGKRADYTCICVIGVDAENNTYVLDIVRFKTDKISEYFKHIMHTHQKWEYKKIRAEVTAAQSMIVSELKKQYIVQHGLCLAVEEYRPSKYEGTKEERIIATLQPKYEAQTVWHYKGGNTQILEEELLLSNPPHDDVKDALTSVLGMAIAPSRNAYRTGSRKNGSVIYNARFGGCGT